MFWLLLKKEIKVFFTNKGNLAFMVILPIFLIAIFSFALGSYVEADYNTFDDGKVLYCYTETTDNMIESFQAISSEITASTGVTFEKTDNFEDAKKDVDSSKAYGVINVGADMFTYYRSTFNEPEGGAAVRSLFVQLSGTAGKVEGDSFIERVVLDLPNIDSKGYYTFSGLAFCLLFMGLLVAHSVYDERELDTIVRIKLSKAGIAGMMVSKVITGLLCGLGQILVAYLFSTFALNVDWGSKTLAIIGMLLVLSVYSAVFGMVIGLIAKSKSMCQSIVLMISMISGYLGGSITPLYLLQNNKILNWIIKVSPLYWENRSINSLYGGIADKNSVYAICVLGGLAIVILALYFILSGRKRNNQ